MKTKIIIISSVIVLTIIFLFSFYQFNLGSINNEKKEMIITISPGSSMTDVTEILNKSKLIKNKSVFLLYVKLNKISAVAGTYRFYTNENVHKITKKLKDGEVYDMSYWVTFVEGRTLKKYSKTYSDKTGMTEKEVIATLSNKEYLKELIVKYWFLTEDILNEKLFFPLEGYLFPDTYKFKNDTDLKVIVNTQLKTLENKLAPFKEEIIKKNKNVHDIITLASIVEKEANEKNDRLLVASVFQNRLRKSMSLGSDVTTYYAEQVEMGSVEDLYQSQYLALNNYNTRNTSFIGLPVGPICNPGMSAIEAAINPPETDNWYFWADIKGKVFFAKTLNEHNEIIKCKGKC